MCDCGKPISENVMKTLYFAIISYIASSKPIQGIAKPIENVGDDMLQVPKKKRKRKERIIIKSAIFFAVNLLISNFPDLFKNIKSQSGCNCDMFRNIAEIVGIELYDIGMHGYNTKDLIVNLIGVGGSEAVYKTLKNNKLMPY